MKAMKNPHGMCPLTAYFNANKDSHPDDKPPLKQCDRPLHIISVLQDRAQVFYVLKDPSQPLPSCGKTLKEVLDIMRVEGKAKYELAEAHKRVQSGDFASSTAVHSIGEVSSTLRDQKRAGEKPSALDQLEVMERCLAVDTAGQAMAAKGRLSLSTLRRPRPGPL